MCGLAGIILKQKNRAEKQTAQLTKGFSKMLIEAEKRGNHATGFAIIDSSSEFMIHKSPTKATDFVKSKDTRSAFELVDSQTSIIMGHTRYGTLGSRHNNANNHPIRTNDIIGTHNGSVQNHKELFKRFDMNRFAEVDSEVLFRMFATSESLKDFLINRLPKVQGRVSMVWVDTNEPDYIYMFKGNNPLVCFYSREYEALLYGSTHNIARKSKLGELHEISIPENTLWRVNSKTLKYKTSTAKVQEPVYKNRTYNHKIGAYQRNVRNPRFTFNDTSTEDYSHTIERFTPRFSYRDQLSMFKKTKASDGSNIKQIRKVK